MQDAQPEVFSFQHQQVAHTLLQCPCFKKEKKSCGTWDNCVLSAIYFDYLNKEI